MNQLVITLIYSGAFLLLFAIGEMIFHVLKFKAEHSRKIVHIFTGLICMSFPFFITTHWSVLFLTLSFVAILAISIRFNYLNSINGVDRKTSGSYLFPISIYIMYWAYAYFGHQSITGNDLVWESEISLQGMLSDTAGIFYFLPLLIFSFADPAAAIIGKKWPLMPYTVLGQTKTLSGSIGFLTVAFCFSFFYCTHYFTELNRAILVAITLAFSTTISEGLAQKGTDNIFVPLIAVITLYLFQ